MADILNESVGLTDISQPEPYSDASQDNSGAANSPDNADNSDNQDINSAGGVGYVPYGPPVPKGITDTSSDSGSSKDTNAPAPVVKPEPSPPSSPGNIPPVQIPYGPAVPVGLITPETPEGQGEVIKPPEVASSADDNLINTSGEVGAIPYGPPVPKDFVPAAPSGDNNSDNTDNIPPVQIPYGPPVPKGLITSETPEGQGEVVVPPTPVSSSDNDKDTTINSSGGVGNQVYGPPVPASVIEGNKAFADLQANGKIPGNATLVSYDPDTKTIKYQNPSPLDNLPQYKLPDGSYNLALAVAKGDLNHDDLVQLGLDSPTIARIEQSAQARNNTGVALQGESIYERNVEQEYQDAYNAFTAVMDKIDAANPAMSQADRANLYEQTPEYAAFMKANKDVGDPMAEDMAIGKRIGVEVLADGIFLPAKALEPETTIHDITPAEWAIGAGQLATIGLSAGGSEAISAIAPIAAKVLNVGATTAMTVPSIYLTAKDWDNMSTPEKALSVIVDAALTGATLHALATPVATISKVTDTPGPEPVETYIQQLKDAGNPETILSQEPVTTMKGDVTTYGAAGEKPDLATAAQQADVAASIKELADASTVEAQHISDVVDLEQGIASKEALAADLKKVDLSQVDDIEGAKAIQDSVDNTQKQLVSDRQQLVRLNNQTDAIKQAVTDKETAANESFTNYLNYLKETQGVKEVTGVEGDETIPPEKAQLVNEPAQRLTELSQGAADNIENTVRQLKTGDSDPVAIANQQAKVDALNNDYAIAKANGAEGSDLADRLHEISVEQTKLDLLKVGNLEKGQIELRNAEQSLNDVNEIIAGAKGQNLQSFREISDIQNQLEQRVNQLRQTMRESIIKGKGMGELGKWEYKYEELPDGTKGAIIGRRAYTPDGEIIDIDYQDLGPVGKTEPIYNDKGAIIGRRVYTEDGEPVEGDFTIDQNDHIIREVKTVKPAEGGGGEAPEFPENPEDAARERNRVLEKAGAKPSEKIGGGGAGGTVSDSGVDTDISRMTPEQAAHESGVESPQYIPPIQIVPGVKIGQTVVEEPSKVETTTISPATTPAKIPDEIPILNPSGTPNETPEPNKKPSKEPVTTPEPSVAPPTTPTPEPKPEPNKTPQEVPSTTPAPAPNPNPNPAPHEVPAPAPNPAPKPQPGPAPATKPNPNTAPKPNPNPNTTPNPNTNPTPKTTPTPVPQPKPTPVPQPKPQPVPQPKPNPIPPKTPPQTPPKGFVPPPVMPPPLDNSTKQKRQVPRNAYGLVSWKQGAVYWNRWYPYNQEDSASTKNPPKGAVIVPDSNSAYDTIQTLTGMPPDQVPPFSMGFEEVFVNAPPRVPVRNNRSAITFIRKGKLNPTGISEQSLGAGIVVTPSLNGRRRHIKLS